MFAELVAQHPWQWTLAWQSTVCLAAGLGKSYLLRRQAVRAHQVLLLGLVAAVFIPAISQIVKQNQWGLFVAERAVPLRERPTFPSQPEIVTQPSTIATSMRATHHPIENAIATPVLETKRFNWAQAAMFLWLAAAPPCFCDCCASSCSPGRREALADRRGISNHRDDQCRQRQAGNPGRCGRSL